jgi:hypothetical protein
MKTLEIKTKVDTSEAEKAISRLDSSMEKLVALQEKTLKEQSELNKNVKDSSDKAVKSLDSAAKATGGLAKGFKGVGLAIKAAGIGIIIGALSALKDVFMQNQDIADAVASSFEAVSIVFNQLVGSLVDTVKEISEATDGFDKLGKVAKGILTIALTPLKAAFYGLVLGVKEAQLAWENSFLGDKDPETVKRLNEEIVIAQENLKEVGTDAANAGSDIVNNFAGAITEVAQVAEGTIDRVKEISIEAAIEQGKANTELKNNAALAAAQQQRIVEQYDRQAEKLRQVRDLESNTIEERIAANNKLDEVLSKQEAALLAQAQLQIDAAQAAVDVNDSIENKIALTEALSNQEGILAQVEGFRSEQQANINGLTREANQLTQTQIEGQQERARQLREFNAEQAETEELKLEKLRNNLATEYEIILEDLERKRELYALGTQARIDAEEEYLNKKQELDLKGKDLTKKNAKAEEDITKSKEAAKGKLIGQGFELAGKLASNNANAQKGIAAAGATFDTYAAIAGSLRAAQKSPGAAIPGYAIAQAIATGVFGFAQVAKILSTNVGSSGGSPSFSGGASSSPSVPETSDSNIPDFDFINQGVGGNAAAGLNRSYVVLQDLDDQKVIANKIDDLSKNS